MLLGNLVKTVTADGIELQGFWIDKKSEIAIFHSHGTAGDFYTHKFIEVEGEKLPALGVSFLTANNRGHDVYADLRRHKKGKIEWVQIGSGFEKFEDCIYDIDAWLNFLEKQGVKKVILQGHSLGPNKNVYYQAKNNNKSIVGFIHLSPQNDAGLMKSVLGSKRYLEVNQMIEQRLRDGLEKEMLPKKLQVVCPISVLAYAGYFIEKGKGNLFPYHNPDNQNWKILNKIKEPQLLIFGEKDPYIKPSVKEAVSVFQLKVSKSSRLENVIIKNAGHSYVGQERELVNIIFNWVKII